jgi:hypothetical protein
MHLAPRGWPAKLTRGRFCLRGPALLSGIDGGDHYPARIFRCRRYFGLAVAPGGERCHSLPGPNPVVSSPAINSIGCGIRFPRDFLRLKSDSNVQILFRDPQSGASKATSEFSGAGLGACSPNPPTEKLTSLTSRVISPAAASAHFSFGRPIFLGLRG